MCCGGKSGGCSVVVYAIAGVVGEGVRGGAGVGGGSGGGRGRRHDRQLRSRLQESIARRGQRQRCPCGKIRRTAVVL